MKANSAALSEPRILGRSNGHSSFGLEKEYQLEMLEIRSQSITVDASSIRAPRASPRIILSEQRMFFMLGPNSGKTDLNAKLRKSEHINVDRNPGVARISPVLSDRSVLHWGCGGGN